MISHVYNGTAVAADVVFLDSAKGIHESAELGYVSQIEIVVDDPSNTLAYVGHKSWDIQEDAEAANNQSMWYGFVGQRQILHTYGGHLNPTGRIWAITLVHCNTLLQRRLLTAAEGASRPAETVAARLTWLLTTNGLSGIVSDYGNVQSSSVALDAVDYTNRYASDVMQELALRSGYTYYIRRREASADFELFFFQPMSAGYDAGAIDVSNDKADVADPPTTTFAPSADVKQTISPDRVASTVAVPTADTTAYATDAAVASAFAAIDLVNPDNEITDPAKAETLAARLLAAHATEEEVVSFTIRVPKAKVNDLRAGQIMMIRATHFDETNYSWSAAGGVRCRVRSRAVSVPDNQTQDYYDIKIEAAPTNQAVASTVARLYGPNDNNIPGGLSGSFVVNFDGDGEDGSPPGGCSTETKNGPLSYLGAVAERTGIGADGSGTPTIACHGTISGVGDGNVTLTAQVRVNGTAVITDSQSTSGGLRALAWTWDMSDTVSLEDGDVIDVLFTLSGSISIFVIPAGVGDCANMLRVSGSMVPA